MRKSTSSHTGASSKGRCSPRWRGIYSTLPCGRSMRLSPIQPTWSWNGWTASLTRGCRQSIERGDTLAPSSPDLSPLDFFLWGYLKEQVYLQTSPLQLGGAEGQGKEGDEGAAREPGQKDSAQYEKEGSKSGVRKWGVGGFWGVSNQAVNRSIC